MLYLNLNKLVENADKFIEETLERHRLFSKLDMLNGIYPEA